MTRPLLRLLPLAALLLAAAGAAARAPVPAPAPAAVDADPALWVVKDRDTTIWLFGTIHVLKPGLSWFDEAVRKAFDRSRELRLEMVLPDKDEAQRVAMRIGTTATGPSLPERLPPAARARYQATLAGLGVPPTALDRFQPWFAANNLTILPLLKLGYALDSGAERVLSAAAKEQGKPVTGFETMEQQLGFFAGLSEPAQVDFLTGVLDDLPKVGATVEAMVKTWSRGDPAALATLLNDDLARNPELTRTLLAERNARWADWIAERMKRPGSVFVAVGAGHLAGRDSVQELLAARGLKAKRIAY